MSFGMDVYVMRAARVIDFGGERGLARRDGRNEFNISLFLYHDYPAAFSKSRLREKKKKKKLERERERERK